MSNAFDLLDDADWGSVTHSPNSVERQHAGRSASARRVRRCRSGSLGPTASSSELRLRRVSSHKRQATEGAIAHPLQPAGGTVSDGAVTRPSLKRWLSGADWEDGTSMSEGSTSGREVSQGSDTSAMEAAEEQTDVIVHQVRRRFRSDWVMSQLCRFLERTLSQEYLSSMELLWPIYGRQISCGHRTRSTCVACCTSRCI